MNWIIIDWSLVDLAHNAPYLMVPGVTAHSQASASLSLIVNRYENVPLCLFFPIWKGCSEVQQQIEVVIRLMTAAMSKAPGVDFQRRKSWVHTVHLGRVFGRRVEDGP